MTLAGRPGRSYAGTAQGVGVARRLQCWACSRRTSAWPVS